MDLSLAMTLIIAGLATGGVYGLLSSSFSFQLGWLGVLNFSFGAVTMLGMFLVYQLVAVQGLPLWLAVVILAPAMILLGTLVRRFLITRREDEVQILVTMGLAIALENIALMVWGSFPRALPIIERGMMIGDIYVSLTRLGALLVAGLILLGLHVLLSRSWTGRAIRSVVQNREMATALGVNAGRVELLAFALSWGLIAVSAGLLMMMYSVDPHSGGDHSLMSFVVCVLAGISNLRATFFAGLVVGVISSVGTYFVPALHDVVLFVAFIILLFVRPQGLFSRATTAG